MPPNVYIFAILVQNRSFLLKSEQEYDLCKNVTEMVNLRHQVKCFIFVTGLKDVAPPESRFQPEIHTILEYVRINYDIPPSPLLYNNVLYCV